MSAPDTQIRSIFIGALLCCCPAATLVALSCFTINSQGEHINSHFRGALIASVLLSFVSLIQTILMLTKLKRTIHRILIIGFSRLAFSDLPKGVYKLFWGLLLSQFVLYVVLLVYFWKASMSPIISEAIEGSVGYFRLRALGLYAGLLMCFIFASTRLGPLLDRIRIAFAPSLRRLVVYRQGIKRELDICFITSRIVVVSQASLSNPETTYLESQYSNFLKHLPSPADGQVVPLSTLSTIVDTAVQHLFSNPVNIVSINTPGGDANSVLIVCALLLRTGAVHPPTAENGMRHFARRRFTSSPSLNMILPNLLMTQLRIFESIMTKQASREFLADSSRKFALKRVSLSHFDSEKFSDIRLSVVDVASGKVVADTITPSVSTHGLTFVCSPCIGSDSLFVFKQVQGDAPLFKLYMHAGFHLTRPVASTSVYHYVSNTDSSDHWSARTKGISARIEVVATPLENNSESKPKRDEFIDWELLNLPTMYAPAPSGCFIV